MNSGHVILIAAAICLFVSITTLIVSCEIKPQTAVNDVKGSLLRRVHDDKYQVVCWSYATSHSASLSCLPEDQLKLREVRR